MAPARAGFCPLLLPLLLGLWVAKDPVSAKPKHMTSAQWFETQHMQPSLQGCTRVMGNINKHRKYLKGLNTFLHESLSIVEATCQAPSIACKNGQENCLESIGPVSLTMCEFSSGRYPNGRSKDKQLHAQFFIVAHDPSQQKDDHMLIPVLLDNVV